jgi:hypothetical protein
MREVDGAFPHTQGAVRIVLAPYFRRSASRPVAGARTVCAARTSLGMHFRLSRGAQMTQHAADEPRAPHQHREGDPRFCSFLAVSQPVSSRIIGGTVVGSDSVAERANPLSGC